MLLLARIEQTQLLFLLYILISIPLILVRRITERDILPAGRQISSWSLLGRNGSLNRHRNSFLVACEFNGRLWDSQCEWWL